MESFQASPQSILKVAKDFPNNKFACAHLGGLWAWDGVEEYLCGQDNLYFDTSFIFTLDPGQALRIIRKHGADHIVFGTDYPWNTVPDTYQYFEKLPLTEEEKTYIYYKNAAALLGRSLRG